MQAESPVPDRIGAYGSFNERDGLKHQGQLDALQRLVDSLQQELKTGAKLVDELQSKSKVCLSVWNMCLTIHNMFIKSS